MAGQLVKESTGTESMSNGLITLSKLRAGALFVLPCNGKTFRLISRMSYDPKQYTVLDINTCQETTLYANRKVRAV